MTHDERELAEAVVGFYRTIEPMERKVRRTDWLFAGAAVVTIVFMAVVAYDFDLKGWWVPFYLVVCVGMGFLYGVTYMRVRRRREAFQSLHDAHEVCSLELAVDDDE